MALTANNRWGGRRIGRCLLDPARLILSLAFQKERAMSNAILSIAGQETHAA